MVALLLLASCGPKSISAPATSATPVPATLTAAASVSVSPPTNRPSPEDLKCDLPVEVVANVQGEIQGGFLHFPGGAFHHDPSADSVVNPGGQSPTLANTASYDTAVGRWLPVPRAWVSADGLRYAYAEGVGGPSGPTPGPGPGVPPSGVRIHLVDLQSRADRVVFSSNSPPFYEIASYTQEGIYLSAGCAEGCDPQALKLWRLDATTGSISKASDRRGFGWLISDGAAWVATYEGSNQQGSLPNNLLRLDLTSGLEATWLTDSGLQLIGLDAEGNPLVTMNGAGASTLLRVTAPGHAESIFSGPSNGQFAVAVTDRHGTWLAVGQLASWTPQGIYLYANPSGMRRVSDLVGLPLGPCR